MTAKKKNDEESIFLVSLEGLDLSKDQKKRIEEGIRNLVLKEIAGLDFEGDIKISRRFAGKPTWEELWKMGQLAGFWIGGFPNFPPGGPR